MTKFIKCQFPGNPATYTYAILSSRLKDAKVGDYLVVPAGSTNAPKVVVYLGEDENPNPKIPYKHAIQFVNNTILARALETPPVYSTQV